MENLAIYSPEEKAVITKLLNELTRASESLNLIISFGDLTEGMKTALSEDIDFYSKCIVKKLNHEEVNLNERRDKYLERKKSQSVYPWNQVIDCRTPAII